MKILFTSVGRRVGLMRAFRKSILDLKLKCEILAPAIQEADRHFLIRKNTHPQFIPSLLEICKNEKVLAIFPLSDFFQPNDRNNHLRDSLGLGDKFVVGYFGVHGRG